MVMMIVRMDCTLSMAMTLLIVNLIEAMSDIVRLQTPTIPLPYSCSQPLPFYCHLRHGTYYRYVATVGIV